MGHQGCFPDLFQGLETFDFCFPHEGLDETHKESSSLGAFIEANLFIFLFNIAASRPNMAHQNHQFANEQDFEQSFARRLT